VTRTALWLFPLVSIILGVTAYLSTRNAAEFAAVWLVPFLLGSAAWVLLLVSRLRHGDRHDAARRPS
jgi:hypothetical protein